jgi:exopolysaccharide biosynthesis protein
MKQILANPDLSEDQKPLCAINGGFWTDACLPLDWCIIQGIESTKLTNQTRPCIIFCDNSVQIEFPEEACSLMKSMPTCSVLQTGPCLLYRGEIRLDYSDYQLRADEFDSDITKDRHPRTLFGYSREEYFFMVIDGRSRASIGLYLEECAALLSALGCSDAVNLDGGASSTMYFDGYRVNHPRFSFIRGSNIWSAPLPGKERPIPNAILAFPR